MSFQTQILSHKEKFDYLRLIRSENVGPVTFFKLIDHFGSASEALKHIQNMAKQGGKQRLKLAKNNDIEKEFRLAKKQHIQLIAFPEPEYPSLLRQIHDPPPILYVIGNIAILRKKSFAIVGTRNASMLGLKTAYQIASEIGENATSIVSGMAKGIDAKAHEAALPTGTVAILGGGVNVIYPKENKSLYHRIAEAGAIISEMPIDTQPIAKHFPRRNRIISGMSRGLLVIEAARSSGSLITANMAIDQNREVFAIPGHPSDERSRGPNQLIKQGAVLTEDASDILSVINNIPSEAHSPLPSFKTSAPFVLNEDSLAQFRKQILELLTTSPVEIDIIIREINCPYGALSHILLELELAGRLVRYPGNKVSLLK